MALFFKEHFKNMNEDSLCQEVLIPLLQAMKFRDVTYTHGGSGEQGKDIVCWKVDELGSRRNYALVVKAIKVTGKAKVAKGTAGEILTQIQQCFGESYLDPITTEPQLVHQCWVVSNQEIGKEAERAIRSSLAPATLDRNVQFIDGERLWSYIEQYLPFSAIWSKLEEMGKTLGQIDTHYQPRVTIGPNSNIHFDLVEKFPGASIEKPIELSTTFQFPETPEGEVARQAFERSFKTGEPADIPLQYLQSVELPDFLASFVSLENLQNGVLHIGEVVNSPHIFVKIKVVCEDGDFAEIEYVDFAIKRSGLQKITLENKEYVNPYHIELEISPEQNWANIKFNLRPFESLNVYQIYRLYYFQQCLSKPCTLFIINLENDLSIFSQRAQGLYPPIQQGVLEEIQDLIEIQKKLKIPINFPTREFNEDELRTINHLRAILHKPSCSKEWDHLDVEIPVNEIDTFLGTVGDRDDLFFIVEQEEQTNLFGVTIPIGKVQFSYRHAMVDNLEEIKQDRAAVSINETIQVHLIPNGPESIVEVKYLEWAN